MDAGGLVAFLDGPHGRDVGTWLVATLLGVLVYAVSLRVIRRLDGGTAQARAAAAVAATPHGGPWQGRGFGRWTESPRRAGGATRRSALDERQARRRRGG